MPALVYVGQLYGHGHLPSLSGPCLSCLGKGTWISSPHPTSEEMREHLPQQAPAT